jgi:hypothetical protein
VKRNCEKVAEEDEDRLFLLSLLKPLKNSPNAYISLSNGNDAAN